MIADRTELISRLEEVSYYRLSGYLYPFRVSESDDFLDGTKLSTVWKRYCFDRRLRVLMLDGIERVEVSIRTKVVHRFSLSHGPFGHLNEMNLPMLKVSEYLEWRAGLLRETQRSKEIFKKHFFKKYTDHQNLPLWMAAELISMGSLLTFFKGVEKKIRSDVAKEYGLPDDLMVSWLRSLNAARNICAHHSRFWNRTLGYEPLLPRPNKFPDWHGEFKLPQHKCGVWLMICRYFLQLISSSSQWHKRIEALFDEYAEIPLVEMGLSDDWRNHPVWIATDEGESAAIKNNLK